MTTPKYKEILLGKLHLDPKNPRIPKRLKAAGTEAVTEWFLADANLTDLMQSIATQGFFPGEPLLVAPRENDEYVVVEGNRRLAACRLLVDPATAPKKKRKVRALSESAKFPVTKIPCLIFPNREAILKYLGYRHITGTQPWEPLAKARYARELIEGTPEDLDWTGRAREVARLIGSRSDYVLRLLTALAIYERIEKAGFYKIPDLDEDSLSFSLITAALNRKKICAFLGLGDGKSLELKGLKQKRLKQLTRWMFAEDDAGATVLGDSRSLTDLANVVANKSSLERLEEGRSLSEALRFALDPAEAFEEAIAEAREATSDALETLASLKKLPKHAESSITALKEAVAKLAKGAKRKAKN